MKKIKKPRFVSAHSLRKCESSQVFVKNGLTHCIDSCKEVTMCGEAEVPREHLGKISFNK